jgi:cell division protein FtsW
MKAENYSQKAGPGIMSITGAGRSLERKLLFWAGIYAVTGMLVLYSAMPLKTGLIALIAALVTTVAFFLVSLYWSYCGYRGDLFLFPVTAVLSSTGLVFLFRLDPAYGIRQFIWLLAGLFVLVLVSRLMLDFHFLSDYKYIYAMAGMVALLLPIFFGEEQGGAKRWLDCGLFQVQPAEFVKILMVLFLAVYLAENKAVLTAGTRIIGWFALPDLREWGPLAVMWGLSLLLLIFQRDLGTALIYFSTFVAMVYTATSRLFYVFTGLGLFVAGAAASFYFFDHVRTRVEIWLNPWPYIETSGYQVIQSLFAIGSGGLTGTGLGGGYPGLLPAVHTDFIFSAICEEMGLLGGTGVIILFLVFVFRGIKIALNSRDEFSALAAAGFSALLGLQVFIIIAGVTKLLPLTGITVPFVSYGGSSLIANFILLGLLLNISHEACETHET